MRVKAGLVGLMVVVLAATTGGVASAKLDDGHVFTDPQPLPATFRVLLPDTGLQQYALFQISGDAPKRAFKKLEVQVEFNNTTFQDSYRYAAGFTKPKKDGDTRTTTMVLAINNLTEGESIAAPPGSTCADPQGQPTECPPGTINVTISEKGSAKDVVFAGVTDLEMAAIMLADDVTRDEILGFAFGWFFDFDFPTPAKKIFGFVEEGAKENGLDVFRALPPEPPL